MRDIAAAAGVSPALVLHHYGTKAGLVDAVNDAVAGVFDEAMAAVTERPQELTHGSAAAGGVAELLLAVLPPGSPVPAYLTRLLLTGDPVGHRLFERWYAGALAMTAELTHAGVMRPTDDPEARAAFLLANDLAVVLLRTHVAGVLGVDPLTPDGMRRWAGEVLPAYTHGVFTEHEVFTEKHGVFTETHGVFTGEHGGGTDEERDR